MLALVGGEIGSRGVAFVATVYIAHRIGPAGFGVVGFATALAGYFILAVRGGVTRIGVRAVATAPDAAPALALGAAVLRLLIALVAFGAVVMMAQLLHKPPQTRLVLVLTSLLLFSEALDSGWAYTGLVRTAPVAAARILSQLVFAVAAIATVHGPADVPRVPIAQVAGEMIAALVLLAPLAWRAHGRADLPAALGLLRATVIPLFTGIVRTLIYSFDIVVLGFVATSTAVGLYTGAYRLCFLLVALSAAIVNAYLPAMTQGGRAGPAALGDAVERTLEMAATIAAPLIGGGLVLAIPLMMGLFGPEFAPGGAALRMLLLSVAAVYLHAPLTSALLATGHTATEFRCMALAAIVTVILDLAVIPRTGIVGAAAVTALAEGIALLLCWRALAQLGTRVSFAPVARPAAAAAVMVASLYAVGAHRTLPLYIAVGAVVYTAALTALGGVPADARASLRAATLRVAGGAGRNA